MSISVVDKGKQILTWDFRNPASSSSFNRLYTHLLSPGIYSGGQFTRLSDTVISMGRMTVMIHSNEREDENISLRIETTEDQDISLATNLGGTTCDPEKCYIVGRFGWEEVENNFMDFVVVKYSDNPNEDRLDYIMPKDLIFGKVLFIKSGGDWIIRPANCFDYTRRSRAFIPDENSHYGMFRVQSCEEDTSKVHVTGGTVATSKSHTTSVGGNFPAGGLPPTDSMGRHDLVFIDVDGQIQIQLGIPSVTPKAPVYGGRRILAEIRRGPNRNDIIADDIIQVNPLGQSGTIEASTLPLIDADDYFVQKNIEGALKQAWEETKKLEELLAVLNAYSKNIRTDLEEHVADIVQEGIVHGIDINAINTYAQNTKDGLDKHIANTVDKETIHGIEICHKIELD